MLKNITLKILDIFDFFYQKKIINFLHEKGFVRFKVFFDIGGHKGESIDLFSKNFQIDTIYSFEASPITFKILLNKKSYFVNKYENLKLILENYAVGASANRVSLKHLEESSSSTIRNFNKDSTYLKKKLFFLQNSKNKPFYEEIEVEQIKLSDYVKNNNIIVIDFLKIDTEGYEFDVLTGAEDVLSKVKIIFFEHHYDDMIKKNYTFSNINDFLKKNNFIQIFKSKMPFRKTLEYIYINKHIGYD